MHCNSLCIKNKNKIKQCAFHIESISSLISICISVEICSWNSKSYNYNNREGRKLPVKKNRRMGSQERENLRNLRLACTHYE
jgi:hypothetical protein